MIRASKAPTVSFTRLMCAELAHQLGCLLGKIGAFRDPHRSEFEKLFTLGKLRATVVNLHHNVASTSSRHPKPSTDEVAPSGKLLCVLVVIRDVKHPWNYTEVMITRVVCFGSLYHNLGAIEDVTVYLTVYGNSYTYTTRLEPYALHIRRADRRRRQESFECKCSGGRWRREGVSRGGVCSVADSVEVQNASREARHTEHRHGTGTPTSKGFE
ncbi:hypothetical protein K438DRAFT_1766434 [Mycena galopus ATCC 62051]|nr:hypothetical protein K438DRAFT_1766434 [Mycena galopus ATCC 62051]